jgi:tRNA (adenine37-N6)-methyltransferase
MQEPPHSSIPPHSLVTAPIGWVRSPYTRRFGTPQQAAAFDSDAHATLELDPARIPVESLRDLDGFSRVWVLSWLDQGRGWGPVVVPPRGPRVPRGVFATRSPDRPNPLGLSAVTLTKIDGLTLHVLGIDLLDGTPVLDIKPYVPYADAFPDARAGWIDEVPQDAPQIARFDPNGRVKT